MLYTLCTYYSPFECFRGKVYIILLSNEKFPRSLEIDNKINSYRISKRSNKDQKKRFSQRSGKRERGVDGEPLLTALRAHSRPREGGQLTCGYRDTRDDVLLGRVVFPVATCVYIRPSLSEKGIVPNGTRGLRKAVVVLVLDQHALASLVPVWELNLLRAAVFLAN